MDVTVDCKILISLDPFLFPFPFPFHPLLPPASCQVLGRAIVNVVAGEGRDRVERHEPLDVFQQRMQAAGFEMRAISDSVLGTATALIQT